VSTAGKRQSGGGAARAATAIAALKVAPSTHVESVLAQLGPMIDPDVALLCVLDADGDPPAVLYSWGLRTGSGRIARRGQDGFVARSPAQRRPTLRALDPERDADLIGATPTPLTHAAAAAIRALDRGTRGHLIAGFTGPPEDQAASLWAMKCGATLLSVCLHFPGALDRFVATPRIDALTGCVTYEHTLHELRREVNRSARAGTPLSCCFVDLDGFKHVNDEHGHLLGNEVLAEVSQALRSGVRSFDTVGRYGGDEFVVILPQTAKAEACALAERLLRLITRTSLRPLRLRLTASIGVAEWKPGMAPEDLLANADGAMLRAKALGGRVVAATGLRPRAATSSKS